MMDGSIGYAGVQAQANKQPEMTMLCERLGRIFGEIRDSNDRAADSLRHFCNEPSPPPTASSPNVQAAEPPPGTLGSLASLVERLNVEASRFESMTVKLRGIL